MAKPFSRRRDGTIEVRLAPQEANVLRQVAEDLAAAFDEPDELDDGFRRLFPRAYQDEDAEQAYQELTRDDLIDGKVVAARTVSRTLAGSTDAGGGFRERLDDEQASAWLAVLNDARLILGTRLDVNEEMAHEPLPGNDPRAAAYNMYLYLGGMQELLIEAMMPGVFVPGPDED